MNSLRMNARLRRPLIGSLQSTSLSFAASDRKNNPFLPIHSLQLGGKLSPPPHRPRRMFTFRLTRRTRWKFPLSPPPSPPIPSWLSDFFSPADGFHSEKLGKLLKHERSSTGEEKFEFCCRKKTFFLLVFPCEIHLSLTSQRG